MYKTTVNELSDRIFKLIPNNLHILKMESAWDLFDVDGFKCDDISPSFFQATCALSIAKSDYKNQFNLDLKRRKDE